MKTAESNVAVAQRWDDIVFEGRNQSYGAYVLRKIYGTNVFKGVVITLVILTLLVYGPAIYSMLKPEEVIEKAPPKKLVYTELSAPPPIDKPKPPPPQVQLPKLQKVIKFVPPKVVKEEVVEEVPTIEEIKQNEVAAVEVEGPTEVVFEEPVQEVVVQEDDNQIFTVVEQQPEFQGGYEAMMNFIRKNMRYPASARRMGVDGTVYVQFVVGKDGAISEVKTIRGISADCDKEAERVVNMMPPWKAGKQNGKPVFVRFVLPIRFKLN
ncbi:energy transducer TonB [Chryseosolibacter indicus]|uniref:TonB family protein n=1 Tax=Chryseosolibacter indicus TaxID=2782351 RepID=A0ABS5VU45_9BACT|nr:energy transducer TonB [Chryseosolibacter indicus]MBT1704943.1 TonB family protein [Chryseosolibacter indicus]